MSRSIHPQPHSTHAIDYTLRHTWRYRQVPNTPVSQPCTLLVVALHGGETSVQLQIPCFSGVLRCGQENSKRFDYERQFTSLLCHNFPYVPDCCAKKVFDTFSPILETANNTHNCPYHGLRRTTFTVVHTVEIQVQPLVDAQAMDMAIRDSFDEFEPMMRPATKESVGDLFKARINESSYIDTIDLRQCVICMEEMKTPNSATLRMPCSHLFHEPCLVKWLNTSHICPLCRFEMPTES